MTDGIYPTAMNRCSLNTSPTRFFSTSLHEGGISGVLQDGDNQDDDNDDDDSNTNEDLKETPRIYLEHAAARGKIVGVSP